MNDDEQMDALDRAYQARDDWKGEAEILKSELARERARRAVLEEGLRRAVNSIDRYDAVLDPDPPSAEDLLWRIRDDARSLLADQGGAL